MIQIDGILSGFAKLELFPIWNLAKDSFVNLAYEAATVNIDDKVIEDTFYKEKYGITATSYNRDRLNLIFCNCQNRHNHLQPNILVN